MNHGNMRDSLVLYSCLVVYFAALFVSSCSVLTKYDRRSQRESGRVALHPKIMFLKIIYVVFLISGFTFWHYRFGDEAIYFCICIMTLTFQRSYSRNVAHDYSHEWVQYKINNFPMPIRDI